MSYPRTWLEFMALHAIGSVINPKQALRPFAFSLRS
jgi:hypothetical protein